MQIRNLQISASSTNSSVRGAGAQVRGANISLKNRLAKLELMLRKKDELAENLHVPRTAVLRRLVWLCAR